MKGNKPPITVTEAHRAVLKTCTGEQGSIFHDLCKSGGEIHYNDGRKARAILALEAKGLVTVERYEHYFSSHPGHRTIYKTRVVT